MDRPMDTASVYANNSATASKTSSNVADKENVAAVFEKSGETKADSIKKTYTPNTTLVSQLKADADMRNQQLQDIVSKLITGQGSSYSTATGKLWEIFGNGDYSTVSEAAIAQAKEDVAEGGYYSVDVTAGRIIDFAKALTGGDPDKIDSMLDAFKRGYKEATGAGGHELPEISSRTYDAVLEGFENWRKESSASLAE